MKQDGKRLSSGVGLVPDRESRSDRTANHGHPPKLRLPDSTTDKHKPTQGEKPPPWRASPLGGGGGKRKRKPPQLKAAAVLLISEDIEPPPYRATPMIPLLNSFVNTFLTLPQGESIR